MPHADSAGGAFAFVVGCCEVSVGVATGVVAVKAGGGGATTFTVVGVGFGGSASAARAAAARGTAADGIDVGRRRTFSCQYSCQFLG